jgi:hypothetical protein
MPEFLNEILNYGAVYLGSMFKFILGPVYGAAAELTFFETFIFSFLGMMTTVTIFTFLGDSLREKMVAFFRKDKRLFTPKNRKLVSIWNKYGVVGVAFLTPLFLSPIGGAIIANSFGGSKKRILGYMAASACFWGITYTVIFEFFGNVFF